MPDMPGHTNLHIGRMDGRLTALESRIDRHEVFVTAKLNAIETKLDDALMTQAAGSGNAKAIHLSRRLAEIAESAFILFVVFSHCAAPLPSVIRLGYNKHMKMWSARRTKKKLGAGKEA